MLQQDKVFTFHGYGRKRMEYKYNRFSSVIQSLVAGE